MNKQEISCKVLILGESKVGKSSILNRFTEGVFTENLPPTLGIDYKIMKMVVDDTDVKLQIWDTAGQERFRAITESFYRGCHGVILVFDVSDKETFEKVKGWIRNIKEKAGKNVEILLVGNKIDLKDANGVDLVDMEEIEQLALENEITHFLVSAKEDINIKETFQCMAEKVKKGILSEIYENGGVNLNQGRGTGRCCSS